MIKIIIIYSIYDSFVDLTHKVKESFPYDRLASETNRLTANNEKVFRNWKIVKGDNVICISGKDKGKTGQVTKIFRNRNQLVVEGLNQKQKKISILEQDMDNPQSAKIIYHPLHLRKVALIDPETKFQISRKACRVKIGYLEDGQKVRISKKSGAIIQKPLREEKKYVERIKNKVDGMKDTPADSALEVTYKGENFDLIKKQFEQFIEDKERKEKLLVFDE